MSQPYLAPRGSRGGLQWQDFAQRSLTWSQECAAGQAVLNERDRRGLGDFTPAECTADVGSPRCGRCAIRVCYEVLRGGEVMERCPRCGFTQLLSAAQLIRDPRWAKGKGLPHYCAAPE